MLSDTIDRASIEKLVRMFYKNILKDELLSPFFIRTLGDDLKNDKWYEHLITLDNFWLSLLTGEGRYMGDPLLPHIFMGQLAPEHFELWLKLFRQTLDVVFTPTVVIQVFGRAKALSTRFMVDLEISHE